RRSMPPSARCSSTAKTRSGSGGPGSTASSRRPAPVPDPAVAVGPAPDRVVVGLVRALRAAGIEVPVGATVAFAEALGALDVSRRAVVCWACRGTLLRRPEDTPVYDRVWTRCSDGLEQVLRADPAVVTIRLALEDGESDGDGAAPGGEGEADDGPTIAVRW